MSINMCNKWKKKKIYKLAEIKKVNIFWNQLANRIDQQRFHEFRNIQNPYVPKFIH